MPGYTDQVTGCAREVVFAIDVLDRGRRLLSEHVSLDSTLATSGFRAQKCAYLEIWVNKKRFDAGKDPIETGTIKRTTTFSEVIEHVCS
jgi:hypothetical protein